MWINSGVVALQAGAALADSVAVTLANTAGAGLVLLADQTLGSLAGGGAAGGDVDLGAFTLHAGANHGNTDFAGVISGSGGLVKQGSGSLSLSGANRYSGATTVAAGALALQGGAALADTSAVTLANAAGVRLLLLAPQTLGALAGGGAAGGELQLGAHTVRIGSDGSNSVFDGVISGAGALVKQGAGRLTLTGANRYAGATLLQGGELALHSDAQLGSVPLLASAGHLLLDGGSLWVASSLRLASARGLLLGAGGGTVQVAAGQTLDYAGTLAGAPADGGNAGRLVKAGDGRFSLDNPGDNSYGGGTSLRGGELVIQRDRQLGAVPALANAGHLLLDGGQLRWANSVCWPSSAAWRWALPVVRWGVDAGAQVSYHGVIADDPAAGPAAAGGLDKAGGGQLTLAGASSHSGLTRVLAGTLATAGAQRLPAGGRLKLANGASLLLGGDQTLAALADLAGQPADGTARLVIGAFGLTLNTPAADGRVGFGGQLISNGGRLLKQGDGLLRLAGGWQGIGALQIDQGELRSVGSTALSADTAVQVASGATWRLDDAATVASLALSGNLAGPGHLTSLGPLTLDGALVAGPLTSASLASQGHSTLAAPVVVVGTAAVQSDSLRLADGGMLQAARISVLGGGSLTTTGSDQLGAGADLPATLRLSASESVALEGGQVLTALRTATLNSQTSGQASSLLAAPVQADVSASLLGGSLVIGATGQLSTPLLNLRSGTLSTAGAAGLDAGTRLQMAPGSRVLLGGDQTLAALADLGPALAAPGAAAAAAPAAADPARLLLGPHQLSVGSNGADSHFSGHLSGSGSLVKQGAGRLLLTADQAHGDTRIEAGILQLGEPGTHGSLGSGAVLNHGLLRFARSDDLLLANAVSGSGALAQAGSGSLTLTSSANSYTGATQVLAGTLKTDAADRLPDASAVQVAAGARLLLGGAETVAEIVADGALSLAGSLRTSGDQRLRGPVTLASAAPITLSAPGHTIQALHGGNQWGTQALSVQAGRLLLSAGRDPTAVKAGEPPYRDLVLGAISLSGLAAPAPDDASSQIDAGRLRLGARVATGQAASGDARIDGRLQLDGGALILRAHAAPHHGPIPAVPGEGTPVDPLKGRELWLAEDVITQSAHSQAISAPGASLQLLAPAGGSITLDQAGNQLAGALSALSGAAWNSAWAPVDLPGGRAAGQSRISLAGAVLQIGGRGLEADLLRVSAGRLATEAGSVLAARLWYNDAGFGVRSSTPALRLALLPEAFATPFTFCSPDQPLQVSVGERGTGPGNSRDGLSAGYVQVLPRAGAKGSTAVYLAGPRVGVAAYSFFHDGAGDQLELPVFYNGVLPATPQLSGSLSAVASVSETARRERFDEAVRTENVAIRLRAGVIAEVGPGRPATTGSQGIRPPPACRAVEGQLGCAP